jgi:hypothetical protein
MLLSEEEDKFLVIREQVEVKDEEDEELFEQLVAAAAAFGLDLIDKEPCRVARLN